MDKKKLTTPSLSTAPSFRRLAVPPARGTVRPNAPPLPSAAAQPTPKHPAPDSFYLNDDVHLPKDLAAERVKHGFDDIPVSPSSAADNKSFWQLLKAWSSSAFHHNTSAKDSRKIGQFVKNRNYLSWKDDLKWAINADLEEHLPDDSSTAQDRSKKHAATMQPPKAQKTIDININITPLPKLPKPSFAKLRRHLPHSKRSLFTRKRLVILSLVLLTLAGSYAGYAYLTRPDGTAMTTSKLATKPEYSTMLPAGKSIETLGGWTRVSPPDREPVFAYVDKIDSNKIIVSQQPLPKQFKDNTASQVESFAKGYLADVKITAGNTTAYIGTSAKGPQSVIFSKNNLLILIKSSVKIDNSKWGEYISSLQ